MSRAIRLVLVCLLAMALPLQGAVAATMIACATGPDSGKYVHHHHAGAVHDHAVAAHDHAGAAQHHAGAVDDADSASYELAGKCPLCASCCAQAALPSTVAPTDSPDEVRAGVAWVPDELVRHTPEAIERPPRPLTS